MQIFLKKIQIAFFYSNLHLTTASFYTEETKKFLDGEPTIIPLPNEKDFEGVPSITLISADETKRFASSKLRADYFLDVNIEYKESSTFHTFISGILSEVKTLRDLVPVGVDVKRFGFVTEFDFVTGDIVTNEKLIDSSVAKLIEGDLEDVSIQLIKKTSISNLKFNNILNIRRGSDVHINRCKRDFNTDPKFDYSGDLTSNKLIELLDECSKKFNIEELQTTIVK